jgi:uncharacterized protein
MNMTSLDSKLTKLQQTIRRLGSCAVAFSGGVDSTLVLKVAHDLLPDKVVALTALSESLPAGELEEAQELARTIGAEHIVIRTFETADQNYLANAANRCYFCKTEMYARIGEFARSKGVNVILDGLNLDDLSDRRPGRAAAVEHGVISPLVEADLTKAEVRELSRRFGLPTWDKPALACLSSRIPHGTPITLQSLAQVDRAEMFLKRLGVGQVRVRHHGQTARIEVEPSDFELLREHRSQIEAHLASLGFLCVEIDPEGYRSATPKTPADLDRSFQRGALIRSPNLAPSPRSSPSGRGRKLPVLTQIDNAS